MVGYLVIVMIHKVFWLSFKKPMLQVRSISIFSSSATFSASFVIMYLLF